VPVTAPADRRFMRGSQTRPGLRQSPWVRWVRLARTLMLSALLMYGGWSLARWTATTPVLRIQEVVITGNSRLSSGEVMALVDGLRGQHLLSLRLGEWRARLLKSPWVADAMLRRVLPATVEVAVTERKPIAIGRVDEELFLVDEHGSVIDDYGPRYQDLDLPILDGLGPESAREVNERRAGLAMRLLRDVRTKPDIARRISQLDVSDPHNAVVIVDADTARVRLGEERFLERLQAYFDLAPTLRDQVPAIDYVDLRFGERVYVGAQAGAPTVAPAAMATGGKKAPQTSNQ